MANGEWRMGDLRSAICRFADLLIY